MGMMGGGDSAGPKQQVMNQPYQTRGPRYERAAPQHTPPAYYIFIPTLQLDIATTSSLFVMTQQGGNHGVCFPSHSLSVPLLYKEEKDSAALQRAPSPSRFTTETRRQWGFNYLGILMGD